MKSRKINWYSVAGLALFVCLPMIAVDWKASPQGPKAAKWEKFDQQLYRYQISSGWIVRYGSSSITFVPDPTHGWKTEAQKKKEARANKRKKK